MSEAEVKALNEEYAAAAAAADSEKMEALLARAGTLLQSVEGDVFFTAEENRAELLKVMDKRLVQATTSAAPALASAAIKSLLSSSYRLDDDMSLVSAVKAAERVRNETALALALCTCLQDEALSTSKGRNHDMSASVLLPIAGVTSIVPTEALWDRGGRLRRDNMTRTDEVRLTYFRNLPGFPRVRSAEALRRQINFLRAQLHVAQDACVAFIEKCLKVDKKRRQDQVLAWLSRCLALARDPGFRLNLAYIALKLAAPVVDDSEKGQGLLRRVDWSKGIKFGRGFAPESPLFEQEAKGLEFVPRNYDADEEEQDDDDEEEMLLAKALEMSLDPQNALPAGFRGSADDFLTEIFWLGNYGLGALGRAVEEMRDQAKKLAVVVQAHQNEDACAAVSMMHRCGWVTHLHDPRLLKLAVAFATTATRRLTQFAQCDDARSIFGNAPASIVKRACDVWTLQLEADPTGFDHATAAVLCCALMKRADLISSPIVHAKLVDVVSTMMFAAAADRSTDLYSPARRPGRRAQRELAGAVMDDARVRAELPVALASLYSQLQAVVGLDVDKDQGFDKFAVRHRINDLLIRLWRHPLGEPKRALADYLRERSDFTAACLDNIVYCVEDAVDRLRDGKAIENAAARMPPSAVSNSPAAAAQILANRLDARRRHYYDAQRRAARGFLDIAKSTFELVDELPLCWADDDVAGRGLGLALSLLHKLGALDSPPQDLDVQEPVERWGFNRPALLGHCSSLLTEILLKRQARAASTVAGVVRTLDFDAKEVLAESKIPIPAELSALFENSISSLLGQDGAAATDELSTMSSRIENALAALPSKVAAIEAAYSAAFDTVINVVDLVEGNFARDYYFRDRSTAAMTLKPLQKEVRKLQRDLPPPHIDGSIFVRFEESALQTARCCVAGPVDTPYFAGLFIFDVYFPHNYPSVPPLLQLTTTGNGLARFNPNLYADGKVCLSLLGTWHAAEESEKWNPATSNLRQILLSIQTQLLVSEPYFNEPGRELQKGTKEGDSASALLNADIRLKTIKFAINQHLKNPPLGLEDVAAVHFDKVRPKLLAQCKRDIEAAPPQLKVATERAVRELLDLIERKYPHQIAQETDPPPPKRAKQLTDSSSTCAAPIKDETAES